MVRRAAAIPSVATLAWLVPAQAQAQAPIAIVAAENVYGDIAKQIGGTFVTVTSILTNPDQDPHLFEASASVARSLSGASVVIFNGADYDPWVERLMSAARNPARKAINVAALAGKKTGDNPHIWYEPNTMLTLAKTLADTLTVSDPAHAPDYARNLATFQHSVEPLTAKIGVMHTRLAGTPVTATEPVFGYMFDALGMTVRNLPFQTAVMNNTEPSASDVAAFENDLKNHQIKLLVYNSQASNRVAMRMQTLAKAANISVVGATETEPPGKQYQAWMMGELDAVDRALPK